MRPKFIKYIPGPNIIGFEYVRARGRESHNPKLNLDPSDESIEDLSNRRAKRYRRASWLYTMFFLMIAMKMTIRRKRAERKDKGLSNIRKGDDI